MACAGGVKMPQHPRERSTLTLIYRGSGGREAISHVLALTVVLSTAITDLGTRGPLDCYVFY